MGLQVQVRGMPRRGDGAAARGARGVRAQRRPQRAAPHAAVAGLGGRVLRGRRVSVAARRAPHEAAGGRPRHHAYQAKEAFQK